MRLRHLTDEVTYIKQKSPHPSRFARHLPLEGKAFCNKLAKQFVWDL